MQPSDPYGNLPPDTDPSLQYACPSCGQVVDIPAQSSPAVECPACHAQFFLPSESPEDFVESEEQTEAQEAEILEKAREEQLSELRIRQTSALRRAAYRTRSYFIIGTLGCAWLGILMIAQAVEYVYKYHHWDRYPQAEVLFAWAGAMGAIKFGKRWIATQREINAEIRAREAEEAEAAKKERDFSLLSDGSQQARNLELMLKKDLDPDASHHR